MKKGSSLFGLLMIVLGTALLGFAAFEALAAFNSKAVEIPAPLPSAIAPLVTPTAPPTQAAVSLPSETPLPPSSSPTEAPASPEEIPTLASIATMPAAPLALPVGSMSRPVRIVIPVLHLDAPVTEMLRDVLTENSAQVSDWQVPKYQVGHAAGSANPGERDNVVMSAHNNLYNALFRKLYTMRPGDEITVYNAAGAAFLYRVAQSYIVQEVGVSFEQQVANAQVMLPTQDARLTLISCYPENNNTHRAIVIAQLIDLGQ
jgi:sortase A